MLRIEQVERVFIEESLAVEGFENVLGHLSLSESVDGVLASVLDVSLVVRFRPFCGVERHGHFDRAFFCGCCFVLHKISPEICFLIRILKRQDIVLQLLF